MVKIPVKTMDNMENNLSIYVSYRRKPDKYGSNEKHGNRHKYFWQVHKYTQLNWEWTWRNKLNKMKCNGKSGEEEKKASKICRAISNSLTYIYLIGIPEREEQVTELSEDIMT